MSTIETPNAAPASTTTDDTPTQPPFTNGSTGAVAVHDGPSLVPPTATITDIADEAITAATWHTGKKVLRLYHAGASSSWIALEGVGWKRINASNAAACTAMTMIAAHAVENGTTVNAYEANDGTIQIVYGW